MVRTLKLVSSCIRTTVGLVMAVGLVSQSVLAQPTTTTRNADQRGTLNGGTTQQRSTIPTGAPQQNAQQQGNNAAAQQAVGAASNVVMTGFLVHQCMQPPQKYIYCAMAAATAGQAVLNLALMGKSKKSADAATNQLGDYNGPLGSGPDGPGAGAGDTVYGLDDPNTARLNVRAINELSNGAVTPAQLAAFDKARGALASVGARVSKDGQTVTTKDGKKIPTAAFASAEGMQALGMSAEQIAVVEQAKAKGANAAKQGLMAMTLDESGGGGRGGAGKAGGGGGGRGGFTFNMPGNKKDLSARSAAGMTRQLDRDKIGVAGDNIFQMVSRQYLKRDTENEFMK